MLVSFAGAMILLLVLLYFLAALTSYSNACRLR